LRGTVEYVEWCLSSVDVLAECLSFVDAVDDLAECLSFVDAGPAMALPLDDDQVGLMARALKNITAPT
jgi:hypothetical protein